MPSISPDCPFYQVILSVHQNQFTKAANQILKACNLLDLALKSVVGENPRCAYKYVGHLWFSPLLYVDNIFKLHGSSTDVIRAQGNYCLQTVLWSVGTSGCFL